MASDSIAGKALRTLQSRQGGEIRGEKLYPIAAVLCAEPEIDQRLDPGLGWFAVHTEPLAEFRVEEGLREAGFATFLPSFLRIIQHVRHTSERRLPLFPRYVFVGFNPAKQPWSPINAVKGVTRLLEVAEQPLRIPDRLITAIMIDDLLKANDVFGHVKAEPIRKKVAKKNNTWKGRKERARDRERRKKSRGLSDWLQKGLAKSGTL